MQEIREDDKISRLVIQEKDKIIKKAIEKLSQLTGEDFHGYISEIWDTLNTVILETREAIANEITPEMFVKLEQKETCTPLKG